MGTQSVAITITCPLIDEEEGSLATGCMLNAFEVPAAAAMAKLPKGSFSDVPGHIVEFKSPYDCPAGMMVPSQASPLNPATKTSAATMGWLCCELRKICSCSR